MNVFTFAALKDELQKTAGLGQAGLEIAGLGALAKPGISSLRDPKSSKKERSHAKWDLGGLGVLAAHPAYEIGKHFMKKGSADLDLVNSALSLFTKSAAKMDNSMASPKPSISNAGRVRDPKIQPLVGDEADWAARTNLISIRGGSDSGRVIPTANQMKTAAIKKLAKEYANRLRAAARIKTAAVNWGVSSGKVRDLAGKVVGGVAAATKKPQFTLQHLQSAYQKSGVKPGLGSAVRSVAHT